MKKQEQTLENKFIRKGDNVIVLSGNFRGQSGNVLSRTSNRVVIEGLNRRKKHMKRTQTAPGQIIEIERPIHVSNVAVCVKGKPVRLRVRENSNNERELYYRDGETDVLYRSIKKSS